MRQKRAKLYRKLLASYIRHFGLRPPLQVLIDAPMALTLAGMKLSSQEVPSRLATVLQVTQALPSGCKGSSSATSGNLVKLMITQCSITELYKVQKEGERERRAVEMAKEWERRYCNHKESLSGDQCLCEIVGDRNKHRYVLAVDSAALRSKIRNEVVGVPVVHTNDRSVLVMEPMSDLTRQKCDEMERKKLNLPGKEAEGITGKRKLDTDASEDGSKSASASSIPRKKRAKEPNPLSMRKPKKAKTTRETSARPAKRKRQEAN